MFLYKQKMFQGVGFFYGNKHRSILLRGPQTGVADSSAGCTNIHLRVFQLLQTF